MADIDYISLGTILTRSSTVNCNIVKSKSIRVGFWPINYIYEAVKNFLASDNTRAVFGGKRESVAGRREALAHARTQRKCIFLAVIVYYLERHTLFMRV